MCNRSPEMMKNEDAGIFPVYYSLNLIIYLHIILVITTVHLRLEPLDPGEDLEMEPFDRWTKIRKTF